MTGSIARSNQDALHFFARQDIAPVCSHGTRLFSWHPFILMAPARGATTIRRWERSYHICHPVLEAKNEHAQAIIQAIHSSSYITFAILARAAVSARRIRGPSVTTCTP